MGSLSFPKTERLYRNKEIQEFFDKGSSFYLYPFRVFIQPIPGRKTHQTLFSVSKKNFKKAVDRNLIKRRMREAYRLNKAALRSATGWQMAYIYTAKDILEFSKIQDKMIAAFKRITEHE